MDSPPTPTSSTATTIRPQSIKERPRGVDIFAKAGWFEFKHNNIEEDLSPQDGDLYAAPTLTTTGKSLSSPSSLETLAVPDASFDPRRAFRGVYDSYDHRSAGLPNGAIVVRNLSSITIPSSPSSRDPSPAPYTIRSIGSTHYLIEKEGLPIWIEKDILLPQHASSAGRDDCSNEKTTSDPPRSSSKFNAREMVFILNVCLAQFLSLAGLAQTFAPLIVLSSAFDITNPGLMAWPTAAYSLTLGSCILPAGRLGDMYGHKKLFMIGWVWFALASVVCGFSSYGGFEMLTGARALQGIGPALLIPNGLALFGRNFPMGMKRNMAISLFGGSAPLGVVCGAVFSSLLAQLLSWPWSFWIMGMLAASLSIFSWLIIPKDDIKPTSTGKAKSRFDFLGAITGVGGLVLINFALNQAPIVEWSTPYIGVTLGVGVVLMCAFVYVELAVAEQPLVPLKGIQKEAALALGCIAAGWGSHGIWSYYMFLLTEQVRDRTPLGACVEFWPVAPVGFAAALAVAFLLKRFRPAYLMSIAMLCFLLGCVFLATAPPDQGYFPNTFLSVIVAPFGMNWSFPTGVILMSNAVHREHQGIAASLVATMVNYSISTGLGFAGSIDRYVTPGHSVLEGYRGAWYFGIGLAGMGFLISLSFIWQSRARK